jgi:hypothetical protein
MKLSWLHRRHPKSLLFLNFRKLATGDLKLQVSEGQNNLITLMIKKYRCWGALNISYRFKGTVTREEDWQKVVGWKELK